MSASWRTSDLTVLAVAGAGTVLLTAAGFFLAPPDNLPRNDGSSFAAHPDGARAAVLVLKDLGYAVDRSFEPVATIRRLPEQTTLVLASPSTPPSEQDVRALKTFVERGGIVLATGPSAAAFLPGVPPSRGRTNQDGTLRLVRPRRQDRAVAGALSDGIPAIELPAAGPLPVDSPFIVVYGTDLAPAVITARFEKGRAIWWAGSAPLANGGIGRPQHIELLVNALGPPHARTILWDEFYHGHTRSMWSYLAGTPFFFAVLQLAGLTGLALFTYSRRRRPIREPVIAPRTSPLEFIDTMGGLYEQARASAAAVSTVYAHARRRLLAALGMPPTTPDDRLATAAGERLALDAGALSSVLASARASAADASIAPRQALAIVSDLQGIAARIEAVRKGRQQR